MTTDNTWKPTAHLAWAGKANTKDKKYISFWSILLLFWQIYMKVFLLRKHSFKDTFTANSFLQRDRKHGEIIRRHNGTNHFYLCPGKVRVQFHNYNEFMTAIQKSVNANGTFFTICIIMIHGWIISFASRHTSIDNRQWSIAFFCQDIGPIGQYNCTNYWIKNKIKT